MLLYFSLTLFVSATLLFLVQPMIGRMILPSLGGTPAVWNTCMVFFQGVLLFGYGYTHLLTTTQPTRRQVLIQIVMLFFPFLVLPFALGNWTPETDTNPIFNVLGKLVVMVGLPFFAVSTTAPLLQKWFGHTGHPAAKDPYFLYGASNLGSMLGLALYPTVLEPLLPVTPTGEEHIAQVHLWTVGFAVFVAMVIGCAAVVWRSLKDQTQVAPVPLPEPAPTTMAATAITSSPRLRGARLDTGGQVPAVKKMSAPGENDNITLFRRLRWIVLAAAPSSLMLGATTFMTTDIAAVAFFWILPLALYLMTFILVFARWPWVWTGTPHTVVLFIQPCFLLFLVLQMNAHIVPPWWEIPITFALHLGAFFTTTLMCHGELAKDRPSTRHLTEFYFWMSFGGVLGGLFNALFAPVVFQHGIWEYPIAMVFACVLRPNLVDEIKTLIPGDSTADRPTLFGHVLDWIVPILIGAAAYYFAYVGNNYTGKTFVLLQLRYLLAGLVVIVLALSLRPIRFGLSVGAIFLCIGYFDHTHDALVYEGRGFFGLLRVRESEGYWYHFPVVEQTDEDYREWKVYRTLIHGGINHGRQIVEYKLDDGKKIQESKELLLKKRREPITYFHEGNGVAEVYHKLSWPNAQPPTAVANVTGLSDARLPASMVGLAFMGDAPWTMLANTQSEPPFAVLGLGTGLLASYAKPYQTVHFYEIDPLVKRLSIVPGYVPPWHKDRASMPKDLPDPVFYFVHDAQERWANIDVILGDGRLKIKDAPDNYYHIISLDAFSSDAIPVHLLTAEAIDLYMSKLVEGGVLVFNTTNKYVRLEGVLAAIAKSRNLDCLYCPDYTHELTDHPDRYSADWVVLQRRIDKNKYRNGGPPIELRLERERKRLDWKGRVVHDAEGKVKVDERWYAPTPLPGRIWTDGYSNMLRIMTWR